MLRIIASLIVFFCINYSALGAIRIAPSVMELSDKDTKKNFITGSFNVQGGKNETIRFKIYPEFFTISDKGKLKVISDSDNERSLVNKLRFVPSEFTVKDGKPQKVRFTVPDIKSLPDGESRLVLFLEDVNTKELFLKTADGKAGGKLIVKTRVGVPVYIDKGKYEKKGSFDSLVVNMSNKQPTYEMKVSSLGNSKIRYTGVAQIMDKNKKLLKEFKVNGKAVAAGKFIQISDTFPIEDLAIKDSDLANCKLRVILTYRDNKDKKRNMVKEADLNTLKLNKEKTKI